MKKHFIGLSLLCAGLLFLSSPVLAAQPAIDPTQIQLNSLTVDQLQQAAEAGDPDAQYALGYMYYYGKRVPQNTAQALNWIKRASVQGQEQAIRALALLGQPTAGTNASASQEINTSNNNVQNAKEDTASAAVIAPVKNQNQPANLSPNKSTSANTNVSVNIESKNIADKNGRQTLVTKPRVAKAPTSGTYLTSSDQLKKAPSNYYTIQLLASSKKSDVLGYSKTHGLQGKAAYYHVKKNGKDLYVLVYGLYKTRADAQAAMTKLPAELRAKNPWVKSVASAQTSMQPEEI